MNSNGHAQQLNSQSPLSALDTHAINSNGAKVKKLPVLPTAQDFELGRKANSGVEAKSEGQAEDNFNDSASSEKDYATEGISLIIEHIKQKGIKCNQVTRNFENGSRILTEQELNGLFLEIKVANGRVPGVTKQIFDTILNSDRVDSYNPLKEFIERPTSRSVDGNIKLIVSSLELPDRAATPSLSDLVEVFFKKWLVGMVASIYDDNYNPLMLVLIGPKGCGKTEFFRRFLPSELKEYFAQSKFNDGKDSEALMCEMLLILNDELDGLHAKEAKAFRNFISANYYYYRPPYGKQNIRRKRLATVCGASNERAIVNDPENNRRIIPIEIIKVNHSIYNLVDKGDLLREAYQLYKNGYDWNLTLEEINSLDLLNDEHEIVEIEYELIQKFYRNNGIQKMTASEILADLQNRTFTKLNINKIGKNLKRLGFDQKLEKVNGKTQRLYYVSTI